jgi:hypothetical protein
MLHTLTWPGELLPDFGAPTGEVVGDDLSGKW